MNEDSEKETRIRKYPKDYKGEIVVFIHAAGDGLKPKLIYKPLFNNFECISEVTVVNKNKMKVLFSEKENRKKSIEEANTLAEAKLKNCHCYIPAKYVEVQGVVSWPINENFDDFVASGKGKFRNPLMKDVKVLDSVRLKKKANVASSVQELEDTSIVIITFEGNLLPDKLVLEKMIVPIREYRRREMFCLNCGKYGHTQKMCNNKKLVNPTYLCMQCKLNDHIGGSIQCPRRKTLEKKHALTMRKLRQRTFAEMLKELDPVGDVLETQVDSTVPPLNFPTRKEEVAQKQTKKLQTVANKPPCSQKPQKAPSTSNKYPPGFKKTNEPRLEKFDDLTITIINGFKSLMNDFNVPQELQQIIVTCAAPHINRFLNKLQDSFQKKMSELFLKV